MYEKKKHFFTVHTYGTFPHIVSFHTITVIVC